MKKKWLAICDEDEKYLYRLQEVLSENASFPFEICVFQNVEKLKKEIYQKEIEVVLLGEGMEKNETEEQFFKEKTMVIPLKKSRNREKEDELGIGKYQSAENIRKQILEIYQQKTKIETEEERKIKSGKIIGVYTPIGRCLQTSFSLLLGQILAKEKNSVLYLNFEPYSGLSALLGSDHQKDLTDLVYFMRGSKEKLMYKLQSMVSNINGLDYIAPAFSFMDLSAVTEEDWRMLLRNLKEKSNYDYIILDLSEMVQGLLNVLRECSLVYTITRKDGFAAAKMEQYERLLKEWEYEDIMHKTRKWEFPIFKQLPAGIEQLPYSELAVYIRKMLEGKNGL